MLHPYINSEDVYDPTSVLAGEIGASPFLINARIIYCNLEEILLPLILKRNLLQKPKDIGLHIDSGIVIIKRLPFDTIAHLLFACVVGDDAFSTVAQYALWLMQQKSP